MADQILSPGQLQSFCESLGMLLRAGVPQQAALAELARSGGAGGVHSALGRTAAQMAQALEQGAGFAAAAAETGAFPQDMLEILQAAELSGRLDDAMAQLARYYAGQRDLQDRLQGAVTYPVALMLLLCGVLAVLVFAVLPGFGRVYESLAGSLAASAYAYIPAARVVGLCSLVLSALIGAALLALALALRTGRGRQWLQGRLLYGRWAASAGRKLVFSRLTGLLAALLAGGMDAASALELCLRQESLAALREELEACWADVLQGERLSQVLCQRQLAPQLAGQLLCSGEESGQLPQALQAVSDQQRKAGETALQRKIDGVEPVLIGYLTLAVGVTLLSVMLPLLGMLSGM